MHIVFNKGRLTASHLHHLCPHILELLQNSYFELGRRASGNQ